MALPRFCVDTEFIEKIYGIEDITGYTPELYAKGVNPNMLVDLAYIRDNYLIDDFGAFVFFLQSNQGSPSILFDTAYYLSNNEDVASSGVPALFHFLSNGAAEKRRFNENIDDYTKLRALLLGRQRKVNTISLKDVKKSSFRDPWDDTFAKNYSTSIATLDKSHNNPIDSFLPGNRVLIIGDLGLPQCKKYRVLQKAEYLRNNGVKAYYSHWLDTPRCMELMQKVSIVIFYRIPLSQITLAYFEETNRLRIKTYYDLDDPLFDYNTYASNQNIDYLKQEERVQLLSNCNLYSQCMGLADHLIGSTPGMCALMEDKIGKKAYLWRNVIDGETINALHYTKTTIKPKLVSDDFVIGYMSGSRAHEGDFATCLPALTRLLYLNPNVRLLVVGHSESSKQLISLFGDRVKQLPFQDYYSYLGYYQQIDLNIIPLLQNKFNDCKSAIRYYEASLFQVPTIVSKIGDFVNIIDHEIDGYLVDNNGDSWFNTISTVLQMSQDQIKVVGEAAESKIRNQYSIDTIEVDPYLKEVFS